MAKIYGLFGSMNGKLADTVMAVRNGVQIVRKYQPSVLNPKSALQVQSRAKLKLISQLAKIFAPIIAIPKEGEVSSRNLFTKKNYGALSYSNNEASVDLVEVKLTDSVVGLPAITATRTQFSAEVQLSRAPVALQVNRVVYIGVVRQNDGTIRVAGSLVVNDPGSSYVFPGTLVLGTEDEVVIYAYGVKDLTEKARVTFADVTVSATAIASLITSRNLLASDIAVTETVAIKLNPYSA